MSPEHSTLALFLMSQVSRVGLATSVKDAGLTPCFYITATYFTQTLGACKELGNDNFILKKIFANAICSFYVKSNEETGCSCLFNEPCRATLFCLPREGITQAALCLSGDSGALEEGVEWG